MRRKSIFFIISGIAMIAVLGISSVNLLIAKFRLPDLMAISLQSFEPVDFGWRFETEGFLVLFDDRNDTLNDLSGFDLGPLVIFIPIDQKMPVMIDYWSSPDWGECLDFLDNYGFAICNYRGNYYVRIK